MCIDRHRFPAKVSKYARLSIGQSAELANIRSSLQTLSVGILVSGDDMEERDEKRGWPGCLIGGVVLIFLPLMYLLSAGPAQWLWHHGSLSGDTIAALTSTTLAIRDLSA